MGGVRSEIEEIVDRETRAWDTGDVDLLLTVFHPDMVWPWPRTVRSHDPMDWVLEWGRYDPERWGGVGRSCSTRTSSSATSARSGRSRCPRRATGLSPWST
jgi:hypothetical protein